YNHPAQMLFVRADLLAGAYDNVRTRLERQMEVDRGCVQCEVLVGLVDELQGRTTNAERRYRRALEMAPAAVGAALRLARLSDSHGRSAELERLLQPIETSARAELDAHSENPGPRWQLAAAAAVRGNLVEARRWYASSVEAGQRDFE